MSLSSSLFTGTSGLKNMGNALQVVGNNIANLSTVGFKKGRSTFADTLYESVATQSGTDQMGRGMAVNDVSQNFSQGSFESTGNTTDLSIGGDGFFVMRQANSQNTFYTRAGNFIFNKGGELVNPEGYVVQGWALDEATGNDVGAIKDVVLRAFTNPPKKSSKVTAVTNLNADANSKSNVLANNWDSASTPNMAAGNYEYQTVLKVYDALGSTHDVTVYYDKKSGTEWEYMITSNPAEDKRNLVQGTDSKGLLARGTILFSQSSGDILDVTMSKFTGRLGNFQANGVNSKEKINYKIINSEELPKDGYGFEFEFDGAAWNFVDVNKDGIISADEKPPNYGNATIVYSDSQQIQIVMNQTSPTQTDPDLIIKMDLVAAATDTFGFDVNDAKNLHKQEVTGFGYTGKLVAANVIQQTNNPSVMTHDSKGLGIVWNPTVGGTGKWTWSNPVLAHSAGTLVSGLANTNAAGVVLATTTATTVVKNPVDMTMVASGIKTRYNGTKWDWNDKVKVADFTSDYSKLASSNKPKLTVVGGGEGAIASGSPTPKLFWTGTAWSLSSGASVTSGQVGNTFMKINTTASSSSSLVFDIWYSGAVPTAGAASTVTYTFTAPVTTAAGQSIGFLMDPTPPQEYSKAVLTQSTSAVTTHAFDIDFDGDNTKDITFVPTAGAATVALVAGNHFAFDVNPDVPPKEYAKATIKGDQKEAIIDLDGSGNQSDNNDIRFSFKKALKFGSSTNAYDDRSGINFDILGSTAWSKIDKTDIATTGYYSFTADFLGGEYGATQTDLQMNFGTKYDGTNFINDSLSTTQYAKSSSTVFQNADGYSAGDLQGVSVKSDGVITGIYSNGQLIPLFRVGLAKFLNNYGLKNEGGNLFRETRDSGGAITNKPGENGLGTIAPNSLEMSNVDISEEFVALIVNQRGFQANSKTITTVDDMMSTVIQMKR